jgi:hypothetical protein
MPAAAIGRDDAVHHVLPVDEIPGLLTALLAEAGTPEDRAALTADR